MLMYTWDICLSVCLSRAFSLTYTHWGSTFEDETITKEEYHTVYCMQQLAGPFDLFARLQPVLHLTPVNG
jgi:hypothetical protein